MLFVHVSLVYLCVVRKITPTLVKIWKLIIKGVPQRKNPQTPIPYLPLSPGLRYIIMAQARAFDISELFFRIKIVSA